MLSLSITPVTDSRGRLNRIITDSTANNILICHLRIKIIDISEIDSIVLQLLSACLT